jgi:hypothetical protein
MIVGSSNPLTRTLHPSRQQRICADEILLPSFFESTSTSSEPFFRWQARNAMGHFLLCGKSQGTSTIILIALQDSILQSKLTPTTEAAPVLVAPIVESSASSTLGHKGIKQRVHVFSWKYNYNSDVRADRLQTFSILWKRRQNIVHY